ncbi:MAG: DUF4430 domain-containing protein [Candidatus Levyibacteriota bacterium]
MQKIFHTRFYLKRVLPYSIILLALVGAGLIAYAFSPKPHRENSTVKKIQSEKVTKQATLTPSPTPKNVLGMSTQNTISHPTIAVKVLATPTSHPTQPTSSNVQNTNTSNNNGSTQSTIPANNATQLPTATPVPTSQPTSTVSLQIQDPAGTSSFTVTLKTGANVCDVLQETKDEGKISSIIFDDSYMSTLHSRYVNEINGFKNNWTFTINGTTPLGCSLANPKPNDTIVWKFG